MKAKQLNRKMLLNKIMEVTQATEVYKNPFGANSYLFKNEGEDTFQIEFIPQNERYHFTIYFRGVSTVAADPFHETISNYLKSLHLNRNMFLDTETIVTQI